MSFDLSNDIGEERTLRTGPADGEMHSMMKAGVAPVARLKKRIRGATRRRASGVQSVINRPGSPTVSFSDSDRSVTPSAARCFACTRADGKHRGPLRINAVCAVAGACSCSLSRGYFSNAGIPSSYPTDQRINRSPLAKRLASSSAQRSDIPGIRNPATFCKPGVGMPKPAGKQRASPSSEANSPTGSMISPRPFAMAGCACKKNGTSLPVRCQLVGFNSQALGQGAFERARTGRPCTLENPLRLEYFSRWSPPPFLCLGQSCSAARRCGVGGDAAGCSRFVPRSARSRADQNRHRQRSISTRSHPPAADDVLWLLQWVVCRFGHERRRP